MLELTIAMVMALLLVCFLLEKLASTQKYLLEHLAILLFGMLVGATACFFGREEGLEHKPIYFLEFSEKIFFIILAPPIFLEAGYSLNRHMFFNQYTAILALGIVGTWVFVMLFACILFGVLNNLWSCSLDVPISLHQCIRLGAIFATTDATALLRIFSNILPEHVQRRMKDASSRTRTGILTSIVIGESLANNGVSLVMFVHVGHAGKVLTNLGWVPVVFIMSILFGIAVALVCSVITKHMDMGKHPDIQFLITIAFAMISYFLAIEVPFVNALVALYSCGFAMAHYTFKNLSSVAKVTAKTMIKSSSWASFTFIYFQMGIISSVSLIGDRPYWRRALPLISLTIILMLFVRALVVGLTCLVLCTISNINITWREQVILNLAGIRGAVSYALCLVWRGKKLKSSLVTTTVLGVVLFTNFVLGSALYPAIKMLFPSYRLDASTITQNIRIRRKSSAASYRLDRPSTSGIMASPIKIDETPLLQQGTLGATQSSEATPLILGRFPGPAEGSIPAGTSLSA
ncbi:hypothetical protein AAMO2058_000885300 [Amorphochlora amoebiformis]